MKYTKYLMAVAAFFIAASCATTDIDEVVNIGAGGTGVGKDKVQVHCRVVQYEDCDVNTRSDKSATEANVSSMALALFPIENGALGNCAYYDYKEGSNIVFVIDRAKDFAGNQYVGKQYAMYVFANMHNCTGFPTTEDDAKGKPITTFVQSYQTVSADIADVPEGGFPMIGSLGDYVSKNGDELLADGKYFILKPAASDANKDGLPEVDHDGAGAGVGYVPTDNLEIPMKALYAKVSFTIKVVPDQDIADNAAPRFDLISYQVNNIAATVDLDSTTNSESDVLSTSNEYKPSGVYAQGATTATFTFYLPERYLTPTTSAEEFKYPFGANGADVVGYSNIRPEDKKYAQRYKGKLVDGKAATYITITGKFCDHQEHTYDVSYNIHLGGDNYSNFDLIRNTHYENTVTIRGIQNSSDQATNTNGIAIDHRVNVKRSTPLVINLRRETLLDAHFEVRPMRLRLVGNNIPTGATARVEVLNPSDTTWIRLEASGSSDNYITSGVSAGKRKYFTTDLVTNTLKNSTYVDVNLSKDDQTVWIYVDENTNKGQKTYRTAVVRVTYSEDPSNPIDYTINQYDLHEVTYGGYTYLIECHEEYLFNYDANDDYGQTEQNGMMWGLDGVKISNEHRAVSASGDVQNWLSSDIRPYYDFYIGKHDSSITSGTMHNYAGQHFTEDIVSKSNSVEVIQMNEQADSAVGYCYNRNKRNDDGSIAKIEWYLPSADELEDIMIKAYGSYHEFQDNYYWTSQPAYIRNFFFYHGTLTGLFTALIYGPMYEENINYARATKVKSLGNNQYVYVESGLNDSYDGIRDDSDSDRDRVNLGYYYEMPYYDDLATGRYTTDQRFEETKWEGWNRVTTYYYVHLGHLYDLAQDGYKSRSEKARVRCAYKKVVTTN